MHQPIVTSKLDTTSHQWRLLTQHYRQMSHIRTSFTFDLPSHNCRQTFHYWLMPYLWFTSLLTDVIWLTSLHFLPMSSQPSDTVLVLAKSYSFRHITERLTLCTNPALDLHNYNEKKYRVNVSTNQDGSRTRPLSWHWECGVALVDTGCRPYCSSHSPVCTCPVDIPHSSLHQVQCGSPLDSRLQPQHMGLTNLTLLI